MIRGNKSLAIRFAGFPAEYTVAVASGAITAATNLATPGTGSATFAVWNGTGYSTSGLPTVSVYNIFTKTGGISSGKVVLLYSRRCRRGSGPFWRRIANDDPHRR